MSGHQIAVEKLYHRYVKLARSIAYTFSNRGFESDDLNQEADKALLHAIEKFDSSKEVAFSTYAKKVIEQQITRSLDNYGKHVRLPVYQSEKLRKLKVIEKKLSEENGEEPTLEEIASESGEKIEVIKELFKYNTQPESLDKVIGEDDFSNYSLLEADINVERDYEKKELNNLLYSLIGKLNNNEITLIKKRFGIEGEEETLADVAITLGVTKEAVRQMQLRVIMKLRKELLQQGYQHSI